MNIIRPEKLKIHLIQKICSCYILLGEDSFLINKNQYLILNYAYKKGFIKTSTIHIEKNQDWKKVILFYKTRNLFFKKTILIVNFFINTINDLLIENINKISSLLNKEILIILKFNHLSLSIKIKKILHTLKNFSTVVSCFTPYNSYFINWIQYEIQEKNINIEKKAFFLLCKYYEGNTSFINKILDVLLITWPNSSITDKKIKKIIINFFSFSVLHWINAMFEGQTKKAIYILNVFRKKKYDPLILIRSLQKDLLILIYMKREKEININMFLKKNNICQTRYKFFINAYEKIYDNNYYQAIKILLKIEINIKKKYNNFIWIPLQKLTLILSSLSTYTFIN